MDQWIKIVAVVILSLSVHVIPASAQTLIRVATPGAVTGAIPIFLGVKKGIFIKHGLNVEVIATRNEQMNMQALISDKETTIAVMSRALRIDDLESLEYSYWTMRAESRPDLFPTEEAIVNVLKTMSYEDPAFASIPPFKYFDLSLIEELKSESR